MSMNTPSQPIGATKQAAIVATVPDQAPVAKQWAYDPKPFLFSPNATPPGSPARFFLHGFFTAPEQDVPCPTMPTIVL